MLTKKRWLVKTDQKAPFVVIDEYNMDDLKDEKIAKILYEKRDMPYLKSIEVEVSEMIEGKAHIVILHRYLGI